MFIKADICSCVYVYVSRLLLAAVFGVACSCFMNQGCCLQLLYESRVLLAAVFMYQGCCLQLFYESRVYLCLCIKGVACNCFMNQGCNCVYVLRVLLATVLWIKGVPVFMYQGCCLQLFYESRVLLAAVFMYQECCLQLFYESRVYLCFCIKGVACNCFMNKGSCLQPFYESRVLLSDVLWIKGVTYTTVYVSRLLLFSAVLMY